MIKIMSHIVFYFLIIRVHCLSLPPLSSHSLNFFPLTPFSIIKITRNNQCVISCTNIPNQISSRIIASFIRYPFQKSVSSYFITKPSSDSSLHETPSTTLLNLGIISRYIRIIICNSTAYLYALPGHDYDNTQTAALDGLSSYVKSQMQSTVSCKTRAGENVDDNYLFEVKIVITCLKLVCSQLHNTTDALMCSRISVSTLHIV